jgi:hypothetical protein
MLDRQQTRPDLRVVIHLTCDDGSTEYPIRDEFNMPNSDAFALQRGVTGPDGAAQGLALVAAEIVHDDDVARVYGRQQHFLDVEPDSTSYLIRTL